MEMGESISSLLAKDEKKRLLEEYNIRNKMGSRVWNIKTVEERDFSKVSYYLPLQRDVLCHISIGRIDIIESCLVRNVI